MNALDLDDDPSSSEHEQRIPEDLEILSDESFIQLLDHASQCSDPDCKTISCSKMKLVEQHAIFCNEKDKCVYSLCKKLETLCCSHAEQCEVVNCTFPMCVRNKLILKLKQSKAHLQQLSLKFENKLSHHEDMKQLEDDLNLINLNDASPSDQLQTISKELRKTPVRRFIESLVHACQCPESTCKISDCLKMKRILLHTDFCEKKTNGGCPICKQLVTLCCHHARHCETVRCQVRFCVMIKHRLKQVNRFKDKPSQLQLRMGSLMHDQCEQIIKSLPIRTLMNTTMQHRQKLKQDMLGVGEVSQQLKPTFPSRGTQQSPTPNLFSQALNQLLRTLNSPFSAHQQQQALAILKSNPPLLSALIKQRSATNAMRWPNQVSAGSVTTLQQTCLQSPQQTTIQSPQQTMIQSPQQPLMMIGNLGPGIAGSSQPQKQAGEPKPHQIFPALSQLLQILKAPFSAQQQQQVLAILKSNPQLTRAFIKQRAERNRLISKEKR